MSAMVVFGGGCERRRLRKADVGAEGECRGFDETDDAMKTDDDLLDRSASRQRLVTDSPRR